MTRRPARADRTYGHRRYQTLAAYTNGLVLLALTAVVVVTAVRRLIDPPHVHGPIMLAVAATGAIANLCAFMALSGATSLNERGARLHVLSDLAGSAAAMIASALIIRFGFVIADPLLSLAVSVLILRSGWSLTRHSAHVLLEGTPVGFDAHAIERDLKSLPDIHGVHHLHAWSLTGDAPLVTLHVQLTADANRQQALTSVLERLRDKFNIAHATVQIEDGVCATPDAEDECHDNRAAQ
jgi:cobalt-zinc-cadmium efflux system protein